MNLDFDFGSKVDKLENFSSASVEFALILHFTCAKVDENFSSQSVEFAPHLDFDSSSNSSELLLIL